MHRIIIEPAVTNKRRLAAWSTMMKILRRKMKDYIKYMFEDEQKNWPKQITCDSGPSIKEKVRITINKIKHGNAPGPYEIQSETLRLWRGPRRRRISWLRNLRSWITVTTGLYRTAVNKVQINCEHPERITPSRKSIF